jgi:sirohydrochlorin ferrochelatase
MQLRSTQRMPKQFGSPTASGGLSRLAADRARRAGIQLEPLLLRAGLTVDQIDDSEQRIDARSQVAFLEIVAQALADEFLGFNRRRV